MVSLNVLGGQECKWASTDHTKVQGCNDGARKRSWNCQPQEVLEKHWPSRCADESPDFYQDSKCILFGKETKPSKMWSNIKTNLRYDKATSVKCWVIGYVVGCVLQSLDRTLNISKLTRTKSWAQKIMIPLAIFDWYYTVFAARQWTMRTLSLWNRKLWKKAAFSDVTKGSNRTQPCFLPLPNTWQSQ